MLEKCPLLRNSNKKLSRRNKEALKAEKTAGDGASFHNGVLKHNRIVFFLKSRVVTERSTCLSLCSNYELSVMFRIISDCCSSSRRNFRQWNLTMLLPPYHIVLKVNQIVSTLLIRIFSNKSCLKGQIIYFVYLWFCHFFFSIFFQFCL